MTFYAQIFVFLFSFPMLMITQRGEGSPASNAISKIEKKHMLKQFHDHGFVCSNIGGGGDGTRFKHLTIGFNTREILNVKTARKYIVEGVIKFINEINQTSGAKDHFTQWPFEFSKLTYRINVHVNNGVWPKFPNGPTEDQKISYVSMRKGIINYYIDVQPRKLPESIHCETLEDAIAILKAEGWTEPEPSIDNK
ncbi:MAG: hypothetical protein AAGG81_01870 [Chlamydiota bacterium]